MEKNNNFIDKMAEEMQNIEKGFNSEIESEKFPLYGMPQPILDLVENSTKVYGFPIEFLSVSCLCACGAALRKKVVLDSGKYKNYPQLWVMLVAPPGVGKSEPLNIAFRPLQQIDKVSYEDYNQKVTLWKAESLKAKESKDIEPEKPFFKQVLIDDSTPESLYNSISSNNGLTLYRDELSGWFSDFGRYSKSGEVSRYLSIYDNNQFTINRKSEEPQLINDPYLSIIGGIQPEILKKNIESNCMKENGFLQRFLIVYPDNPKKSYYSESKPDEIIQSNYNNLIKHLSDTPDYGTFSLSSEAKNEFIKFSNEMTERINLCNDDYLKGMYGKFEIHVLRIALIIFTIIQNKQILTRNLSLETMQYSIDICRYFIRNGEKVVKSCTYPLQLKKGEILRAIDVAYPIKNIQMFADSLGIERSHVSREINKK